MLHYLGTALLAAAATSLVLLTTLGGTIYPWASAPILLLAVVAVLLIVAFLFVERRAPEPVLPLALFRQRVFSLACAIGFVVGFALFGVTTYLPLFLQVVNGAWPTSSGLRMVPLLLGVLTTSIISGQLITRWGRYKLFPIIGTALMTLGMVLLSRMDEHTSILLASAYMAVLGLVMQVLIIAVQNAVEYRNLGAATSGATFFRSIGGSFGTAVFGSIFASLLMARLVPLTSAWPPGFTASQAQNPAALRQLPASVHAEFIHAYAESLQTVFLVAAPIAALAFVLALFLPEVPLRTTAQATDMGATFAIPTARSSREEIERALSVLASRESREAIYRRIAARAGGTLAPRSIWLLFRIEEQAPISAEALARRCGVTGETLAPALSQLTGSGLIAVATPADGQANGPLILTPEGTQTLEKLLAARRAGLAELLADWSPEEEAELATLLQRLSKRLLREDTSRQALTGSFQNLSA